MEHWRNLSLENIIEEIDGIIYEEKWVVIEKSNGAYQISSFGRVKSMSRFVIRGRISTKQKIKERILRQNFVGSSKNRYLSVTLKIGGKEYKPKIHRLVCYAFHLNPKNKPTVNHKKGIKTDNRVHQLEWNTWSENHLHASRTGLKRKKRICEK